MHISVGYKGKFTPHKGDVTLVKVFRYLQRGHNRNNLIGQFCLLLIC